MLTRYQNDLLIRPESGSSAVLQVQCNESIGFRDAIFTWEAQGIKDTVNEDIHHRRFKLCVQGEVAFKPGKINLIVGPTASGKTAMLMALLGKRFI